MLISNDDRLSFEKSRLGRRSVTLPKGRLSEPLIASQVSRQSELAFPEMSELDTVRHFINLSRKNFSVDTHFYPLGSCTMKYNPKVNDWVARQKIHKPPSASASGDGPGDVAGFVGAGRCSERDYGMDRFTLQPRRARTEN